MKNILRGISVFCLLTVISCFCFGCSIDPADKKFSEYSEIQTPCNDLYWCMSKEDVKEKASIKNDSGDDEDSISACGAEGIPDCSFLNNYYFDSSLTEYEFYNDKLYKIKYSFEDSDGLVHDLINKYIEDDIDENLYNKVFDELNQKYTNRYDEDFSELKDMISYSNIKYKCSSWDIGNNGNKVTLFMSDGQTSRSLSIKYSNSNLDWVVSEDKEE